MLMGTDKSMCLVFCLMPYDNILLLSSVILHLQLGGFGLPFFVLGSMVILCGSITAYAMPPIRRE